MMRSNKLLTVLVTTLLVAVGCGPTATTVSGTVTYNGEPVEQGAITFRPADGQGQSFGAQIVDGAYATAAGSPGSRTAVVMGVKKIDFGMSSDEAMRKADEAQAAGKPWGGHLSEPADYIAEDAEGNSQTVEIAAGHQTLNIEVKGPPKP